nr:hypothetical protein [Nocardia asteroides]
MPRLRPASGRFPAHRVPQCPLRALQPHRRPVQRRQTAAEPALRGLRPHRRRRPDRAARRHHPGRRPGIAGRHPGPRTRHHRRTGTRRRVLTQPSQSRTEAAVQDCCMLPSGAPVNGS